MPASLPEREGLVGDGSIRHFFTLFSLDTTVVNNPPYLGNVYLKASLSTTAKADQYLRTKNHNFLKILFDLYIYIYIYIHTSPHAKKVHEK